MDDLTRHLQTMLGADATFRDGQREAIAEIKRLEAAKAFDDPHYIELLIEQHYVHHVLRLPPDGSPDPVNRAFAHINQGIYIPMQGPSELGASGKLAAWDRTADLPMISVPTLVIGARHDTMDPGYMEMWPGSSRAEHSWPFASLICTARG